MKSLLSVLALLLLFSTRTAMAQFTAGVQGSVQDTSGASIPAAKVTIVNDDTKIAQSTTSDSAGVFRFASLGPGNYTVSAVVKGFSNASTAIVLTAAETRNVALTLAIGQVNTSVTVTTQAPLLDTADSRNQQTLDQTALENLPLASRNPTALITLTPGVTGLGASTATNFNPENYVDASANGRGQNGNMYIVDGLDVTSSIRPGVVNLTPNVDSLAETTVQTNTYTVDYGRASSLQTVMSTRSGADQYHGFASEYYTYQGLQARGEFGVPQPEKLAPYHTNNMSFGAGGPVIPGKKFFFFASYEPYLSLTSNGASLQTYEDPAFVAFAQSVRPNSPEVQLFTKYPASNATFRNVFQTAQQAFGPQDTAANTGCGTPSTDNIPCGTAVFDQGNFNSSSYNNSKQYNIRIDKYFSKDRVYGLFYRDTINTGGPSVRPAFNETDNYYTFSLQGNETHTFSPNTLNEAFMGYNRIEGFAPSSGLFTVPIVSVTGLGVGFGDGFALGDYVQHSYHWRDVLTHIHGAHSIKAGYEGWHGDDLAYFAGAYGQPSLSYTNMINLINDDPYSESGLAYDPLTGKPGVRNYGYQETTGGAFVEDTWKVSRKLTINYGIRYDNFGNPYVALKGTVLANFHLGDGATFAQQVANGVMTQQDHVFKKDLNWNFAPRGGFAFDPFANGEWVVRGGFGLYHDYFTLGNAENGLGSNPPGPIVPTFYNNGSTAAPIFGYGTQNTFPFGFPYPAFQGGSLDAKGGLVGSQISVGGVDSSLSSPFTLNWSLAIEHQITRDMTASIGYVGSHSGDLVTGGGNEGATSYGNDVNAYAGDLLAHPSFDSSGNFTGSGTQTRLNTSFGSISYAFNGAIANYQALIVAVKGRFARRGFLTASYTHGKAMDNWQNYPVAYPYSRFYAPSPWDVPNRFSLGVSYLLPGDKLGNSFARHALGGWTLAGTTVLQSGYPFTVYTGNPLALSTTASDGTPLTSANYASEQAAGNLRFAAGSGDFNADGDNNDYPNVTNYKQKHDRKDYQSGHGLFQTCPGGALPCGQFTLPNVGQEGGETPNQFRDPGYADTDFTLKKSTQIWEGVNLELRIDTFNIFNRVNLNGVDTNLADGGFGQTSSTMPPRNMLLGARLNF
ncbi:carboxypeptidase-like regulatory domain-containing protein [Silvibacterium dinghuense]|uniref:Carboxypeptidase regulatory-like domain-containing protein n=1 Tax=Silvibacterium dinghuense TaxID=1560006 RepID=A0A4Q1SDM0_9BACT|nr:carboxypeptidase-like regulatory domain-containing protein [Silvibacterium dinghuense]RXS95187.1 carboxypeptidase regulatory-like domain-containing protein [Silvibacterium dinghuense]